MQTTLSMSEAAGRMWDVVVVGAGPAGALAARQVAGHGRRVLLIDKAAFPRWKVCGSCLNQAGQAALAAAGLGDLTRRLGAAPLTQMILAVGGRQVVLPLPNSLAISREALDAALVKEAIASGADFLSRTLAMPGPVTPQWREVNLTSQRIKDKQAALKTRLVLAADGLGGRWGTREIGGEWIAPHSRIGAGAIVEGGPDFYQSGTIYMARGSGGYAGLVRLENGRINIGAALDPDFVKAQGGVGEAVRKILEEAGWPWSVVRALLDAKDDEIESEIQSESDQAEREKKIKSNQNTMVWRGSAALTRRLAVPAGYRLLVLGDAAGYVEPFTGEGMAWALNQAMAIAPLAARAGERWDVGIEHAWTRRYRLMTRGHHRACGWMRTILHNERLASLAIRLLTIWPGAAKPLIHYFCAAQTLRSTRKDNNKNGHAHTGLGNQPA